MAPPEKEDTFRDPLLFDPPARPESDGDYPIARDVERDSGSPRGVSSPTRRESEADKKPFVSQPPSVPQEVQMAAMG